MSDRTLSLLSEAVESGERLLLQAGGQVWEVHVTDCLLGVVNGVGRRVGSNEQLHECSWVLEAIADVAPAGLEYHELDEDPLQAHARRLREEADAAGHESLAEQIMRDHNRRMER